MKIQNNLNLPSFNGLKTSETFEMKERGRVFRYMDIGGYIPIVGSVVGVCRILSGIAYGLLSSKQSEGKWRAGQEIFRGCIEMVPILGQITTIYGDTAEAWGWKAWGDVGTGKYYLVKKGSEQEMGVCCWDKEPSDRVKKTMNIGKQRF